MTKNYPIFNHWLKTLHWIIDRIERFPKCSRFTLAKMISDSTLKTLENIIEAIYQPKQRHKKLEVVNLELEKLRIYFRIAFERQYISDKQYKYAIQALNETGKMAGGWIKHAETP